MEGFSDRICKSVQLWSIASGMNDVISSLNQKDSYG